MMEDFSTGSTHPNCEGDTDLCPDSGCKNCQGQDYDNLIRGRFTRGDGTEGVIRQPEHTIINPVIAERYFNL
jgi:hypothetical protein